MVAGRASKGVLVIYTGGTIGSAPRNPHDPESPQYVIPWERLFEATPELEELQKRGYGPIDVYELDPPLDSCNVGPAEWDKMAGAIADKYEKYEGFVILHGTDTMVYTASVLSFMLRELAKPVVITGAQRSALVDIRNDATQNFLAALDIANPAHSGLPVVPEVCIAFGQWLLRGNRAVKRDTAGYQAYESPNYPPLGEIGDNIVIDESVILPMPGPGRAFNVRTRMDTNVTTILTYPGIQNGELVHRQLMDPKLRGALVLAYGSGNIPTAPDFLGQFNAENMPDRVIAVISQCRRGPVELGIYDTSAALLEMGFVAAGDITMEAALCKLMILLGDPDSSLDDIRAEFSRSIAGEQTTSLYITKYKSEPIALIGAAEPKENSHQRIPGQALEGSWRTHQIERALLRFRGTGSTAAEGEEAITLRIFANLGPEETPTTELPGFAGEMMLYPPDKGDEASTFEVPALSIFDVTKPLRATARPGERMSFTIYVDSPNATFSWKSVELALYIKGTKQ